MAYVTKEDLAARLPDGGRGLTPGTIQSIIDDARSLAEAEYGTETVFSRAFVVRQAWADALETMISRDVLAELDSALVKSLRAEAKRYLELHDQQGALSPTTTDSLVSNPFFYLWPNLPVEIQREDPQTGWMHPSVGEE